MVFVFARLEVLNTPMKANSLILRLQTPFQDSIVKSCPNPYTNALREGLRK